MHGFMANASCKMCDINHIPRAHAYASSMRNHGWNSGETVQHSATHVNYTRELHRSLKRAALMTAAATLSGEIIFKAFYVGTVIAPCCQRGIT